MPDAPFPSCFGDHGAPVSDMSLPGHTPQQNSVSCLYRTKLASQCRMFTITWFRNLISHGFTLTLDDAKPPLFKLDLRPWLFWRKAGSKSFSISDDQTVQLFWDLTPARYFGGAEPKQGFYVAVVYEGEVVLLLGDMNKDAFKKSGAAPALIQATLVSRREHLFGDKFFCTKVRFCEGGELHEVMIECPGNGSCRSSSGDGEDVSNVSGSTSGSWSSNGSGSSSNSRSSRSNGSTTSGRVKEPRLCIRVDRKLVVCVKRLAWKFRGNQTVVIDGQAVEVFWDVHNWLFNGTGNAVFMFQISSLDSATGTGTTTTSGRGIEKKWSLKQQQQQQPQQQRQQQQQQQQQQHQQQVCNTEIGEGSFGPVGFSLFLYACKNE